MIVNLSQFSQIDDAYWSGKNRDGIRGHGATGKIPFVAAVATCAGGHALQMRFSQVGYFSKNAIMSWGKKHLVPESEKQSFSKTL